MAERKRKWTVIDTVIVIVVIAALAVGYKMLGGKTSSGNKTAIEVQIHIANQDAALGEAIKAGIGDEVTLSLTEKDSGILKAVDIKPAEIMVYDSIKGEYKLDTAGDNVDIYATVEAEVEETDYAFLAGSTQIKVGNATPFRGKGYATEGNVIVIEKVGE